MNDGYTRITIVIPSFNQGCYIEEALKSIVLQRYPNVEIIVMDGGSTDNSVEIIKQYDKFIAYWQSEKDNGQSAAINAGFKKATGTFVTWLNSDDVLIKGTLFAVDKAIKANPKVNFFLGNCFWMDSAGKIVRPIKAEKECWWWNKHYLLGFGGPSAFMRKSCLAEVGYLREDFHYCMDGELWYRFIKNGHRFVRIKQYCWGFRIHEKAKTSCHLFKNASPADVIKKRSTTSEEIQRERKLYPKNTMLIRLWRLRKMFLITSWSRIFDKRLIGKHYSSFT